MRKEVNKKKNAISAHSLRLGIGSYTYGWQVGTPFAMPEKPLTVEGLIVKAAGLGLSLIQIGDNHALSSYECSRLSDIKCKLREHSCSVELGARGLTTARLKEYMDLAEYFHAPLLRFVVDEPGYEPDVDEITAIIKKQRIALERRGITLALENHDRLAASDLAWIIRSVGSDHVGICLDSVNSLGAGEGFVTVLETLAPHTVNLHIKDYGVARLPHKMGFKIEGKKVGDGLLDIPALLKKVTADGKCRSAILEQWVPPEKDIEKTVLKEEQWALESIGYLKKIYTWV